MKKLGLIVGSFLLTVAGYEAYQTYMPFDTAYVVGCEEYVKDGLKAPSTYKRIGARDTAAPVSATDLKKLGVEMRSDPTWQTNYWLHTVSITYDAENSFGVPVRSGEVCTLMEIGAEPDRSRPTKADQALVNISVSGAKIRRILRQQVEAGALDNSDGHIEMDPRHPCCL